MVSKYKLCFIAFVCSAVVALLVNSCKKDGNDTLQYFLTNGTWQLASVMVVHYVGDTQGATDTLNTTCNSTQTFAFTADGKCTYTNYHCITQNLTGSWTIDANNLLLDCTLPAKDTLKTAIVQVNAFSTAQIVTLGQYALVLQTGDIESYYKSTTVRNITRYGFVHATGH